MSRHRRSASPWRRAALALAGVALPVLSMVAAPPSMALASDRFTELRTWVPQLLPSGQSFDTTYSSEQVAVDATRRLLWVALGNPDGLAVYDLDTLLPRSGLVMLPGAVRSLTVDPATGRVLAVLSTITPASGFGYAGSTPAIDEYELQGPSLRQVWADDLSGSLGQNTEIASLGLDAADRAMYVASQEGAGEGGVTISRLPLGMTAPAPQWSFALPPSCVMVPASNLGSPNAAMAVTAQAVYVPCGVPEAVVRPPLTSGIAKVALPADPSTAPASGAYTFFSISGNFNDSHGSVYDAVSGRLIVDEANNESGSEAVFDTGSDRVIGLIDGNSNRFDGIGFDDRSGRLYAMNENPNFGLEAADVRTTPPSQPTTYPSYTSLATAPIPVDSATSRLFVLHFPNGTSDTHAYFRVLRDNLPPLDAAPQAPSPDSNTQDIPEAPGVTGATFSAAAQGFGAVVRQVGGAEAAANDVENFFHISGESDPELRGAYLNSATLSADEATASSIPADRDQNFTAANQNAACASSPQQLQATTCAWPYVPAQCFSSDTAHTQTAPGPSGTATSTCSLDQRSTVSQAALTGGDLGGVTVGALSTSATLLEDANAGTAVSVTSVARDVSIAGGALRIASVVTTATAHAHGRPGTAGTTFSRSVEGVVLDGTTLCDSPCDLDVVSSQVESAFGGRLRIDFPSPDAGYAHGSPGGYQALVRLPESEHLEDVLLSDQPANRAEVAGMVIEWELDTARPSRTLVMLAGVEAEAHYGIYPLDQFTADQSAGLVPSAPDVTLPPSDGGTALTTVTGSAAPTAASPSRSTAAATPISALPSLLDWHGWQWALTHPAELLRLAAIWAVFLVPIYLAARRWSLLRRHHLEVDLA